MNNPELRILSENKILNIISNLKTVEECGRASDVIDYYKASQESKTKVCLNPEVNKFISDARNMLSNKTFEVFKIQNEKV